VAARSETRTVFSLSNTGDLGSNPTQGMVACVRLFCVGLYVGSGLTMGRSPVVGVLSELELLTTLCLPPMSSSWRQSLETHDQYFFQLNTCGYNPYVTSSLTEGGFVV
jgi:hypothetical protein